MNDTGEVDYAGLREQEHATWLADKIAAAAQWSAMVGAARNAANEAGAALNRLRRLDEDEVGDDDVADAKEALSAILRELARLQRIADAQAWRSAQRQGEE